MRRFSRQRAYNIVEMAIALTVLGLLVGGALIPLQTRYERQENDAAEAYLREAKKALIAYAIQNRTASRVLNIAAVGAFALPGQRPYLPCPDIDNDGKEDRLPFALGSLSALTVTVGAAPNWGGFGMCEQQKGVLPWKTLGLQGADPWGNRLTYRVDQAFSDSLTGFDKSTRGDVFSHRDITRSGGRSRYALRASRDRAGAVVCSDFINNPSSGGCPTPRFANVLAGVVTNATLTVGARVIPAHDAGSTAANGVVEGAIFVLVSHGRNGLGAVNSNGRCRPLPATAGDYNMAELANAYYSAGHPLVTAPINCSRPPASAALLLLSENLFVSAPILKQAPVVGNNSTDDIVLWMGANELFGALLRADALPSAPLEYLPR